MAEHVKKAHNFSPMEQAVLIDEVEARHGTLCAKLNNIVTNENKRKAWEEIAAKVNAVNPGLNRTALQIKKKWQDFQSRTKKKEAERRRDMRQTGGGPLSHTTLSEMEGKVISLLGETAIEGILGGVDTAMPATSGDLPPSTIAPDTPIVAALQPVAVAGTSYDRVDCSKRKRVEEDLLAVEQERRDMERERLELEKDC